MALREDGNANALDKFLNQSRQQQAATDAAHAPLQIEVVDRRGR